MINLSILFTEKIFFVKKKHLIVKYAEKTSENIYKLIPQNKLTELIFLHNVAKYTCKYIKLTALVIVHNLLADTRESNICIVYT